MTKKIPYLLVLLFLFAGRYLPAQNIREIDSLTNVIRNEQIDSLKIRALLALSFRYQGYDAAKSLSYAQQALMLAQTINDKRGTGLAHNILGDLYWYKSDYATS